MAIDIITGFDLAEDAPIRRYMQVADEAARLAIKWMYKGMLVYQEDADTYYKCKVATRTQGSSPWTVIGDWEVAFLGSTSQLSDLSDVSSAATTTGFVLVADGSSYEGRALLEADISDLGTYLTAAGNETISGAWTFNDVILAAAVPTLGDHLVNKTYVDGLATTPGGATGDIQYKLAGGGFGGEAAFNYDEALNALTLGSRAGANGAISAVFGTNLEASGLGTISSGLDNAILGDYAGGFGRDVNVVGDYAFGFGRYIDATSIASFAGGHGFDATKPVKAGGLYSFNYSQNTTAQTAGHGALADNSVILGGIDNNIEATNNGAILLGGNAIKLTGTTYIDHTVVNKLAIFTAPSSGTTEDVLVIDSVTGVVKSVTQSSFTGEVNTSSNLGGGFGIASSKSGVDLPFKSLIQGTGITITSDANEITITASASATHDLLSTTHGDTTPSVVSRGSLIVGKQASAVWEELTLGANGYILTSDGTDVAWSANTGTPSPLTTKGDVYTYSTVNDRLSVGTDGYVLTADAAEATGLKWVAIPGGGDMLLGTSQVVTASKTFNDGTLLLDDTDSPFNLILSSTSTITTANKKLTFDVNDADRTLTFSGDATISGTNTGDQVSIVGISGTKTDFDNAVTGGNFMYVGDAPTAHSHPWGDITATPTTLAGYGIADADNYVSWNLKTDGVQRIAVVSGGDLDIVGGTDISATYSAGGVVTLNYSGTAVPTQLSDLSDVTSAATTTGFALMADGAAYVGRAIVEADISDLGSYWSTTGPTTVSATMFVDGGLTGRAFRYQYSTDTSIQRSELLVSNAGATLSYYYAGGILTNYIKVVADGWQLGTNSGKFLHGIDSNNGIIIQDSADDVGLSYNGNYSANGISLKGDRWISDIGYQKTHIGAQLVGALVTTPTATEDGFVIAWNNTNSEYELVAQSGGGSSPLTTKGDVYTYDTGDQRLGVGTNGYVLTADSTEATGLKWAAIPGGGDMLLGTSQVVTALKTFRDGTFALRNVANTFNGSFVNTNLVDRTYTLQDADGTIAFLTDINLNIQRTEAGTTYSTLTSDKDTTVVLSAAGAVAITLDSTGKSIGYQVTIVNNTSNTATVSKGTDSTIQSGAIPDLLHGEYFYAELISSNIWSVISAESSSSSATALSIGTITATTFGITSDGGVDDVILPEANTTQAGLLGSDKWDEIVANTLKATNVSTNLSMGTVDGTQFIINSSDGTNVSLPLADTNNWGLISDEIFDQIVANNAKVSNVVGNLGFTVGTGEITTANGTNITIGLFGTANTDYGFVQGSNGAAATSYLDATGAWSVPSGGGDALVANPLSQFAATTSLQLKGVISDETGSGALVFATSPTLVTPSLGTPSSGVMTNVTGYPGDSSLITVGTIATGVWQGTAINQTYLVGQSGINTGDQTSIVGITGTKAQFNTANTEGSFMYVGDAPTAHTHLLAAGATDVTATFGELNLLDLSGLTAGWVLSADTATTASWKAPTGSSQTPWTANIDGAGFYLHNIPTIRDVNENEVLAFASVASAVNHVKITNATAVLPTVDIATAGDSATVNLSLTTKGAGSVDMIMNALPRFNFKQDGNLLIRDALGSTSTGSDFLTIRYSTTLPTNSIEFISGATNQQLNVALLSTSVRLTAEAADSDFYVSAKGAGDLFLAGGGTGVINMSNDTVLGVERLGLTLTTGDVATPTEGQIWYNNTTNKFRAFQNAAAIDMIYGGSGGAFTADVDTQITPTIAISLVHATNNEIALDLSGTANKAAGNVAWIFADVTNTATPGTFDLMDLQVGAVSKFKVSESGAITSNSDADTTSIFGRIRLDGRSVNAAYFSHFDFTLISNYALVQGAAGQTVINAAIGQDVSLAIGGTAQWRVQADGDLVAEAEQLLILGNKADPDPTGSNGAQYYNTTNNKFRAYENGAWVDLIQGGGGGDMVLASIQTVTGAKTFGVIGGAVDKFILAGSTSGSSILNAAAVAGTTTLTLPGVTGTLMANLVEDTTPQLGGELDMQAHSIGGTAQTATGDGATTIDWKLGNMFNFQFGAFNETFTFTAPTKPGTFMLKLIQDSVGSRTATWPATVKWSAGTAPTLTTTATTGTDIITFYYDGSNYYAVEVLNLS